MRRLIASCLVLLVLSGCAAPAEPPMAADSGWQWPEDPPSDRIGWENGYWHNESIDVDQSDGLSDAELEAYVARSMARVEQLRDREFKESVPVSVISREDYQQQSANNSQSEASFEAWNNQVWEALFITGESQNIQSELGTTYGSAVAGFYSPGDDEIKIVTDSPEQATIDNATLHHELVHAMQDQYHDLASDTYTGKTQDGDLAVSGVVEGEANYIEDLYLEKCGGEWECVETPRTSGGGGGSGDINLGIYLVIFQPYSDGPPFVHQLKQEGGWQAVDDRFADPPVSSEQVIHVTDEQPVPIEYTDRARNGWSLFEEGVEGSDTVGEASLYAMFWYQDREGTDGFEGFDWREVGATESEYDQLNYDSRPTAGWANDRVFPYVKGSGDDAEYGYVWELEWDTKRDATEFRETYLRMLTANGATEQDPNVYVIEDGSFADAFRVTQDGTRVTVVNAPTVDDLSDVRPTTDGTTSDAPGDTDTDGDSTNAQSPGFGLLAGFAALVLTFALFAAARFGRR